MRPFRFAINLKELGWETTVITIAAEGQELTAKEARLLDGIEVVRLKPMLDLSVNAESQLGLSQAAHQKPHARKGPLARLVNEIDRHFPIDSWLMLFWLKHRQIVDTIERIKPDVLWSTGDPWSGLVVGEKMSRRFDIPWVADFRDPWTLCDVRTDGKPAWTHFMDQRYERRILETAHHVLFQATQTEKNYRAHYEGIRTKASTIYNSYDPGVFDDSIDLESATPKAVSEGPDLHLGFFGRFRAMSSASLIIEVLEAAHRRHGEIAGRIMIHPFGPLNREDDEMARARGVADQFIPDPAVPLEKAVSALGKYDLLLLSTDHRRNEIIPAKLLEYLAAARPVLSLSRNPEVAVILEKTGAGIQPGPDATDAIADMLVESVRAKDQGSAMPIPFKPNPMEVERFDARTTTKELAALFESILDARG